MSRDLPVHADVHPRACTQSFMRTFILSFHRCAKAQGSAFVAGNTFPLEIWS